MHAQVSRQYQRRSWQALPPSATIWSADKRMPHIQHDLTGRLFCPDDPGAVDGHGRLRGSSPRGRRVLARGAGTFTRAAGVQAEAAIAPRPGQPAAHLARRRSGMCPRHLASRSPFASPPVRPRAPGPPCLCPPPCLPSPNRGRAHLSLEFQVSASRSLRDNRITLPVNVQPVSPPCGVLCGQRQFSLCAQGANGLLPGDSPAAGAGRCGNPQHFPPYPQASCLFPRVIHRLVHRMVSQQNSRRLVNLGTYQPGSPALPNLSCSPQPAGRDRRPREADMIAPLRAAYRPFQRILDGQPVPALARIRRVRRGHLRSRSACTPVAGACAA